MTGNEGDLGPLRMGSVRGRQGQFESPDTVRAITQREYRRLIVAGVTHVGVWHLYELDGTWVFIRESTNDLVPMSAVDMAMVTALPPPTIP